MERRDQGQQNDNSMASLGEDYIDDNDHKSVQLPSSMNFYERIRLKRETILEKYPFSYQPIISFWHAATYGDEQISESER